MTILFWIFISVVFIVMFWSAIYTLRSLFLRGIFPSEFTSESVNKRFERTGKRLAKIEWWLDKQIELDYKKRVKNNAKKEDKTRHES